MREMYVAAPLPFVGQKRNFVREFVRVLDRLPDDAVYVDLFGGSGLLSHVTRRRKPGARVVYNDFDGFRDRLALIPETNRILGELRVAVDGVPHKSRITGQPVRGLSPCSMRRAGAVRWIISPSRPRCSFPANT